MRGEPSRAAIRPRLPPGKPYGKRLLSRNRLDFLPAAKRGKTSPPKRFFFIMYIRRLFNLNFLWYNKDEENALAFSGSLGCGS